MLEDIFLLLLLMLPVLGMILLADCIVNFSFYAQRRRRRQRRAKTVPQKTSRVRYIVDGDRVRFPVTEDETA